MKKITILASFILALALLAGLGSLLTGGQTAVVAAFQPAMAVPAGTMAVAAMTMAVFAKTEPV